MDQLGYALLSREILEKLLDIKEIYANAKPVSEQAAGTVYLTAVTSLGQRYILKRRNIFLEETQHEFRVGIELSKIAHPNLIKTYMYFQCPCDWLTSSASFILMEYFSGKTYTEVRETLDATQRKLLIRHLCMIIADIQSKIKFTHYDLHTNNVLVLLGPLQEYSYNCYGQVMTITSPFQIKIVDYGTSYVEGISDDWVEINRNTVFNGAVPNVYDNFYDLAFIITGYLYMERIINPQINDLIKANAFIPFTGQTEPVDEDDYYIGREYNPEWSNILTVGLSYVTDRFYNAPFPISTALGRFSNIVLVDFSRYFGHRDIDTLEGQVKLRNLVLENKDNPIIKEKILRYQHEYGGIMAYEKQKKLQQRRITPKQLFDEFMKFTT